MSRVLVAIKRVVDYNARIRVKADKASARRSDRGRARAWPPLPGLAHRTRTGRGLPLAMGLLPAAKRRRPLHC
jgi:hypothetical protein